MIMSSFHQGEEEEGLDGTLERLLAGAACVEQQWETEDDPDVLADPIMQLDIQVTNSPCTMLL